MDTLKIFNIITSILGLNFDQLSAPRLVIVIYQVVTLGFGFHVTFFSLFQTFRMPSTSFYFFTNTIQMEVFYTLQVILVLRAIQMRIFQKTIFGKISQLWSEEKKSNEAEKRFIRNFLFIVLIRIMKFVMATGPTKSFAMKQLFPELLIASSDFLFQFYVTKLTQHVKFIRHRLESIRELGRQLGFCLGERQQILQNFQIKRDIQKRYSLELFVTIGYNFLQLVICFYFICMRVKFNLLTDPARELSFGSFRNFWKNFCFTFRVHYVSLPTSTGLLHLYRPFNISRLFQRSYIFVALILFNHKNI
jgi:hypothetical protein